MDTFSFHTPTTLGEWVLNDHISLHIYILYVVDAFIVLNWKT